MRLARATADADVNRASEGICPVETNWAEALFEQGSGSSSTGRQGDGRTIPHECCVMPKSAGEPALEVADFLMHTIAGNCRSGRDPQGKFARFSSIFGVADERLVSFMEGDSITQTPTA
jgi:hypothetical protein